MSTELHLTIRADSAAEALSELAAIGRRAATESGVAPQPPDPEPELPSSSPAAMATEKGNGADAAPVAEKRTRAKRAPAPEATAAVADREAIVKGLTELYMGGDATIRERITAFRDGYDAKRLRDLKDDVMPAAEKLLGELQRQAGP